LSRSLALAWMQAAPNSRLRNIYGPTEATVSCTSFEVTAEFLDDPRQVSVPLGWAVPGTELVIVDAELEPVAVGQTGELLIGGPQLAAGYLLPGEAGNGRFVAKTFPGRRGQRWYRSADAARESMRHGIVFQGRLDTQVKIRGNRVELEEVEHVVQACSHAALCAVIPWPLSEVGSAIGLTAFVTNPQVDIVRILQACRQHLPVYAVPERIVVVDTLPLNVNGKIDRKVLAAQYMRDQTVG
jgi:D-alanine--poly(phosphoribitol) ligase subunit 1